MRGVCPSRLIVGLLENGNLISNFMTLSRQFNS
jgi:hypothetical protein